jgi:hypothetical protein
VSILRRVNLGAGGYDLLLSGGLTTGLLYHESAISFLLPICVVMRRSAIPAVYVSRWPQAVRHLYGKAENDTPNDSSHGARGTGPHRL